MRYSTLVQAVLLFGTLSTATFSAQPAPEDLDAKARAIDARLLKIDAHTDVLLPGAPEINYVGIGTDFNHGAGITGFNDEGEAPNITRELVRRGF